MFKRERSLELRAGSGSLSASTHVSLPPASPKPASPFPGPSFQQQSAEYLAALRAQHNSEDIVFNYGRFLLKHGRLTEARLLWESSLLLAYRPRIRRAYQIFILGAKVPKQTPTETFNRGIALLQAGKLDHAITLFKKIAAGQNSSELRLKASINIATCYQRTGNTSKALRWLSALASLNPGANVLAQLNKKISQLKNSLKSAGHVKIVKARVRQNRHNSSLLADLEAIQTLFGNLRVAPLSPVPASRSKNRVAQPKPNLKGSMHFRHQVIKDVFEIKPQFKNELKAELNTELKPDPQKVYEAPARPETVQRKQKLVQEGSIFEKERTLRVLEKLGLGLRKEAEEEEIEFGLFPKRQATIRRVGSIAVNSELSKLIGQAKAEQELKLSHSKKTASQQSQNIKQKEPEPAPEKGHENGQKAISLAKLFELRAGCSKILLDHISFGLQKIQRNQEKALFQLGCMLVDKEPDEAVRQLEKGMRHSQHKELYVPPLSMAYDKAHQPQQTIQLLQSWLTDARSYWRLGLYQMRRGHILDGVNNLQKACSIDPDSRDINYALCECYFLLSEPASVRLAVDRLKRIKCPSPEETLLLAKCYQSLRLEDDCRQLLNLHLEKRPFCHEGHYLLGCCHERMGDLQKSIAEFEEAYSLNHEFVLPLLKLGKVQLTLGRVGQAAELAEHVLKISPKNQEAQGLLVKCREGAEKEKVLRKIIKSEPKNHLAQFKLGKLLIRNNSREGLALVKRSLKGEVANREAWKELADYHFRIADSNEGTAKALNLYKEVLEFELGDEEEDQIRLQMCRCYAQLGNFDEAMNQLAHQDGPEAQGLRLDLLLSTRQHKEAREYYEGRLIYSNNHLVHYNMSHLYHLLSEYTLAAACLERALHLVPDFPPALFNRALYVAHVDPPLALRSFRTGLLRAVPSVKTLQSFLERLQLVEGGRYLGSAVEELQGVLGESSLQRWKQKVQAQ